MMFEKNERTKQKEIGEQKSFLLLNNVNVNQKNTVFLFSRSMNKSSEK